MSYSYYEVYNNTLRAFRGMNFPYGSDEDAAYIITYLELYKLDGLKLLANNLDKYDQNFNGTIDYIDSKNSFNLKNKSSLMIAPSLIDYTASKMEKANQITFELKNCSDFIFFIPLLIGLTKKNIYSSVKNKNYIICNINKEKISINNLLKKNINSEENFQIKLHRKNSKFDNLDINFQLNILYDRLSRGLTPKINDWKKISKIAFRTYVPESNESRNKGAGGGDDND